MDGTFFDKKYNIVGRIKALEEGGGGSGYVLPVASDETLGGIKVGNGLTIDPETGILSNNNPTPYTPVSYSTTEQNTGMKWIDGKDIYFKTVVPAEELTLTSQAWASTGVSGADISVILNAFGVDSNGSFFTFNATPDVSSTGNIGFLQTRSTNITITKFVLYYTKKVVTRKKK